jgi:2'-5' RNA ligase
MSPMPSQMEDHWVLEPGTDPGRAQLMWFMCFGGDPEVTGLATLGRARLAGLDGLDLVPSEWLHITTLIVGYADEIPAAQVTATTTHAQALLASVPPIKVTLGRVLYHPRAIMLRASPHEALRPVLAACQEATRAGTGRDGRLYREPWVPHLTLAYGNSSSPAAPAIQALGKELPARQTTVTSVSLISQTPAQKFRWHLIATVPVGTTADIRAPIYW